MKGFNKLLIKKCSWFYKLLKFYLIIKRRTRRVSLNVVTNISFILQGPHQTRTVAQQSFHEHHNPNITQSIPIIKSPHINFHHTFINSGGKQTFLQFPTVELKWTMLFRYFRTRYVKYVCEYQPCVGILLKLYPLTEQHAVICTPAVFSVLSINQKIEY